MCVQDDTYFSDDQLQHCTIYSTLVFLFLKVQIYFTQMFIHGRIQNDLEQGADFRTMTEII